MVPQARVKVAIIGSGPSAFYACEALLRTGLNLEINLFEKLPAPFGLVRYGVAPDHPALKQVCQVFKTLAQRAEVNFFGNVRIGDGITIGDICMLHHAVVICAGADRDRRLDVIGEDLIGSHTATEFVGWYNGHPDYRDMTFDLSCETAVIVGHGNVAADVCRILAKPVSELRQTDICEHALDTLSRSQVREIHLIGRRGPAQSRFSVKELRELVSMTGCYSSVEPTGAKLESEDEIELTRIDNDNAKKCCAVFASLGHEKPLGGRRVVFHFLATPSEFRGTDRLRSLLLTRNRLVGRPNERRPEPTDAQYEIDCGLCFRSIGYRSSPFDGVPFDANRGIIPNIKGRVVDGKHIVTGVYTSGWIKRGPTGIIGTNRADSQETVDSLISDLASLKGRSISNQSIATFLQSRNVEYVDFERWQRIDHAEVSRGSIAGKPREKFATIREMLEAG